MTTRRGRRCAPEMDKPAGADHPYAVKSTFMFDADRNCGNWTTKTGHPDSGICGQALTNNGNICEKASGFYYAHFGLYDYGGASSIHKSGRFSANPYSDLPRGAHPPRTWVAVAMESWSAAAALAAGSSGGTESRGTSFPVRPGASMSRMAVDGTTSPVMNVVWLETLCLDSDTLCQAKETCQQVTGYTCAEWTVSGRQT